MAATTTASALPRTRARSGAGRRVATALAAYPRLTIGAVLLVALLVLSLGAPLFTGHGPLDQHLISVLKPPGHGFLFGTDQLGRDVFSRSLYGGRLVLAVAVVSVLIAMVAGVLLGLVSGYLRGWADALVMRIMDGVIVFPELILALAITYALGPSFWTVVAAISTVNVPKFARVVRGQVLSLREREFISAAKVSGASTTRVLLRHLLPNVLEVTVVQAALTGGMAIFTAASLSFLGLGLPAPQPDWGGMLRDGYPYLGQVPMMSLVPGGFIFVAMLSFNLIGDGLRDLFDPRSHGRTGRRRTRAAAAPAPVTAIPAGADTTGAPAAAPAKTPGTPSGGTPDDH
ncbi:ABC transporter permease [Streptomyces sp. NPDC050560]|uniref:ABC transporter permease n=1 Tax=Streptomyces sp. NPDC050560 TaxID=3365630 RepID=UPI0037B77F64